MVKSLQELIEQLPPELQQEVRDFAEFLTRKYGSRTPGMPSLRWAGALRDLGTRYTSVELQHAILRWRAGEPAEPAEPEP
jgi:hypothetical protein